MKAATGKAATVPPARRKPAAPKPKDIARIFMHGRSQAVRLPKAFRLPGDKVRVRRQGRGILLEPIEFDVQAWYAKMDRLRGGHPFLPEGRPEQPPMPPDDPLDAWD